VVRDPVMTRDPAPVTSPNDPATGQRIP